MNRKLKNEELNRPDIETFKKLEKIPLCVVLDNVRSQNNIGSVFRTSDAYLIEQVCLCGITATPPNKEIHKTALGATESVKWKYYKDTVDAVKDLKEQGYYVISIEQVEQSSLLNELVINKNSKYAVVLGNEVKGVGQDVVNISDEVVELPQFGTKHSLNISVCAGIVIWEFYRQLTS